MTKYLQSRFGHRIPYCVREAGSEEVLLICHGFAGSKDGPMAAALHATFPPLGVTTYSFDLPAHGESERDGMHLRVAACLSDLQEMEEYILARHTKARLSYFASSFGAYLLLLSLAQYPHRGHAALLRSTAVDMHGIFAAWQAEGFLRFVPAADGICGHARCQLDAYYGRSFFITRALLDDVAAQHLYACDLRDKDIARFMIHGQADSVASLAKAEAYAAYSASQLRVLPAAEHRLMEEAELRCVLSYCQESLYPHL